jgi:glycosyltransferase involved in cell wall biosynthesis
MHERDRISVCICTFKRPDLLGRLLAAVSAQITEDRFAFDVVVVDNDARRSAEAVTRAFAAEAGIATTYECETEQNISLARNRAVRCATGNLVAFIDDDEWPARDWLAQLYGTLKAHRADGVLGPVLPDFPPASPPWLRKAGVFARSRHATGTRISAGDGRTGNVLFARSLFRGGELWFDPAFGRTGGEDTDFFARHTDRHFLWCDEAVAFETVPPERWTASFHIKRLLRAGTLDGEWMRERRASTRGLLARNMMILCACAALTPPSLLLPKHVRMRVFQKAAYCGGIVTAYFGLSLLRYRE